MSLLEAELKKNCVPKKFWKDWIETYYGERCNEHYPTCDLCLVWKEYDELTKKS